MTRFATIVADPPWKVRARRTGIGHLGRAVKMPYSTMTLAEIEALPVAALAAEDAVLYLWTVQSMLREAYGVVEAWGFTRVPAVLVWSKRPRGVTRGDYVGSAEFVLYAKRGQPEAKTQQMGTVFEWPRGAHSAKPEAFLDMVERVNPGPYLELFARRARFAWERWGDEVDATVEMPR